MERTRSDKEERTLKVYLEQNPKLVQGNKKQTTYKTWFARRRRQHQQK